MQKNYIIDSQGVKRLAEFVTCNGCGIVFLKDKRLIKKAKNHYCHRKCYTESTSTAVSLICAYCGKSFKRAKRKLTNSKSSLYFCHRNCKDKAQQLSSGLIEIYPEHYKTGITNYREIAYRHYIKKCVICGYDEYEEGLAVHHNDFDRNNNDPDNLFIVCCICHRLIHCNIKQTNKEKRNKFFKIMELT